MKKIVFPMAKKSDPDTSHLAASQHLAALSKRRAQVLNLVTAFPGRTSGELSAIAYSDKSWGMYGIRTAAETPHKRLPELEKLGLVLRGRTRMCKDSNYAAATWWPT